MMNQAAMQPPPSPHLSNSGPVASTAPSVQARPDDLIRVFNTALIGTQTVAGRDFSAEIFELMESPAFRAILGSIRQYARLQGVTEKQAAEQIISIFRKVDQTWKDYVFQEGVDRLKNPTS